MVKEILKYNVKFKNIFELISYFKFLILIIFAFSSLLIYFYLDGQIRQEDLLIFVLSIFLFFLILNFFLLKNKIEIYETYLRIPKSLGIFNWFPSRKYAFVSKEYYKQDTSPWIYIKFEDIKKINRRKNDLRIDYNDKFDGFDGKNFAEVKNLKESELMQIENYINSN